MQSHFFTLTGYPTGLPERELFSLQSQELPDLSEGEVRIRNHWLSVDPYMRGRMTGMHTYSSANPWKAALLERSSSPMTHGLKWETR